MALYNPASLGNTIYIRNGTVGIGTSSPNYKLTVNGAACDSDGSLSACSSDERLKENIVPIKNATGYLGEFNPVEFNFKGSSKKTRGLIAQDVQKIHPELILPAGDGYITYDDPGFKYLLIKAVKEQQEQIETNEREISEEKTLLLRLLSIINTSNTKRR